MKIFKAALAALCLFASTATRAADITGSVQLQFNKNNAVLTVQDNISANTSTAAFISVTQTFTTNDVTIAMGEILGIGYVSVRNMATANTNGTHKLLIGPDGTNYTIEVKSGASNLFDWNAPALHIKSTTNGVPGRVSALPD